MPVLLTPYRARHKRKLVRVFLACFRRVGDDGRVYSLELSLHEHIMELLT